MTTTEGNVLIATYMEDEYIDGTDVYIYDQSYKQDPEYLHRGYKSWKPSELRYDNDWNWLIPVCAKIYDHLQEIKKKTVRDQQGQDRWSDCATQRAILKEAIASLDINNVWNIVLQCIETINKYKTVEDADK